MSATARVQADIQTTALVIHQGAVFNGRSEMLQSGSNDKPVGLTNNFSQSVKSDSQLLA